MAKVLIATTTCSKLIHRIKNIKESWGMHPFKHLYFIGGHSNFEDIITLECNDGYEFLTQKTRKLFEYCLEKEDFDYLLKTNDDSYLNIDLFLNTDFCNYDYGGYICSKTIKINNYNNYFFKINDTVIECDKQLLNGQTFEYGTGGFYFISKKAIEKCLSSSVPCEFKSFDNTSVEDLIVGIMLFNNFKNLKTLNLNHIPKIDLPYDISKNGLSVHPVHYSIMKDLFKNKDSFQNQLTLLKYKAYLSDYLK